MLVFTVMHPDLMAKHLHHLCTWVLASETVKKKQEEGKELFQGQWGFFPLPLDFAWRKVIPKRLTLIVGQRCTVSCLVIYLSGEGTDG